MYGCAFSVRARILIWGYETALSWIYLNVVFLIKAYIYVKWFVNERINPILRFSLLLSHLIWWNNLVTRHVVNTSYTLYKMYASEYTRLDTETHAKCDTKQYCYAVGQNHKMKDSDDRWQMMRLVFGRLANLAEKLNCNHIEYASSWIWTYFQRQSWTIYFTEQIMVTLSYIWMSPDSFAVQISWKHSAFWMFSLSKQVLIHLLLMNHSSDFNELYFKTAR